MIDSVIVKTSFSSVCSETKTKGIMIKFFVSQNQQSGLFKLNKNKNGYIDLYCHAAIMATSFSGFYTLIITNILC